MISDTEARSARPPRGGFMLFPWSPVACSRFAQELPVARGRSEASALVARGLPAVLRGVQDGTVASAQWSFADLRARWGERELPVIPLRDGMLSYESKEGIAYVRRTLRDVLDGFATEGSRAWYVSVRPETYLPGLAAETRVPIYAARATWRASRVWIGTGDTITPLHQELTHNVLCLLTGEKEIALFPPSARGKLEPHAPWSATPHISRIDPRAMWVSEKTRRMDVWRCTLREGDALFIPRGWWHAVRTTCDAIAINYWWASGLSAIPPRAAELYKRVFSLST